MWSAQERSCRTELCGTPLPKGQKMERSKKRLRKSRLSHRKKIEKGAHRREGLEEKFDPKC